ncbi:MAG: dephospho-CoA kinase [Gammaproteobacteria bacterium]|nr:dephospho-CoA kinase [Gammaproteobacteria bacterium]
MREYRVGLTGGIASGKTTVAGHFAALGVPVIDTDEVAREVVAPDSAALHEVVAAFGPDCLTTDGTLDRRRLRARVFADPVARARLEAILHPHIARATLAACARAGGPYQVLVVPLLFESGFDRHVDRILVVDCPQDVQRARLLARDAETPEQADRILAAQLPRATRLQRTDDVIDNSDTPETVRAQVVRLHERYLALSRERADRS